MLRIVDLKKDYTVAGGAVHALKGISVNFRRSEFVSILGPSGCGKTTFLNIIGGLDKYTSGDLQIEGKSTKTYTDRDWDTYRNHSIGFIFQSYHLIPHQSILQNVELALMIAGISKSERRQRAIDALEKVGLKDKIHNKPNQLSGGQAQRVAIARALINDPEIVLADEPTGALDSVTSVQIMELLKEISKDRLVVMVTHNPELAEQYSTRIVRLKDGEVVDDTNPYSDEEEQAERANLSESESLEGLEEAVCAQPEQDLIESDDKKKDTKRKKVNKGKKHSAMSISMAFGLSFKNLLSKRKRTTMVSFAGSIGIIGVSMVLAISSGVQGYITKMENDMLSGYPVSITQSAYDFTSLMQLSKPKVEVDLKELAQNKKVYVNSLLDTLGTFATGFQKTNHITEAYIDYVSKIPAEQLNLIQYDYGFTIANNLYTDFTVSDNLADHLEGGDATGYTNDYNMSVTAIRSMYSEVLQKVPEYKQWGSMISSVSTFAEMPDNYEYIMSQYDVIAADKDGKPVSDGLSDEEIKELFESKDTMIMVISNYQIDDLTLAQYGYFTEDEFLNYAYKGIDENGENQNTHLVGDDGFEYGKFIGDTAKKFTYYPNDCVYKYVEYVSYMTDDEIRNDPQYASYADMIISARNQSNAVLKQLIDTVVGQMVENGTINSAYAEYFSDGMFKQLRVPDADEVNKGFVANAYTNEYTIVDSNGKTITLPAFSEKSGYDKKVDLGVKLILQKKESVSYGCLETGFYYTKALTDYILETEKDSEIVNFINGGASLTEVPMYVDFYYVDENQHYVLSSAKSAIETGGTMMSQMIGSMTGTSTTEYLTANIFGGSSLPVGMYVYPTDFNTKNAICKYLDGWNDMCTKVGEDGKTVVGTDYTYTDSNGVQQTVHLTEKDRIDYNDTVGLIIDMVNTMIEMITIALIVFTALSLVVSTVMIGIITYVSVVERVKEIGILRAVGARKKDIKRLFNAETLIIGLAAGLFGILITYVLSLITNIIVSSLAGFWGIAALPWWQALIMVGLSVGLTLISGLIPASAAAKKDPVVALRTE
ncbi:MAG: ATP-binding cassette domain-containing protein [Candidatus Coproplasma sp.]